MDGCDKDGETSGSKSGERGTETAIDYGGRAAHCKCGPSTGPRSRASAFFVVSQTRIRVDRNEDETNLKEREASSRLCLCSLEFLDDIPAGVYRDHKLRFIAVAAPPLGGLSYRYVSTLQLYLHFLRNGISCQHHNRPTAN